MAETPSTMLSLGTSAPDFLLPCPIVEKKYDWNAVKGSKATVVVFMCNHCPYVLHIIDKLTSVANEYKPRGINFVAINANDVDNYPDDSPEKMCSLVRNYQIYFPYLYDESQEVAKAYHAACTPDFYVFGKDDKLVYRGRFDGATPGNRVPVTGEELKAALDDVIVGRETSSNQRPSLGCNIKWK